MKSGLLSSRFFISISYVVHFRTIGMSLSLKFTNATVKSVNFTFLLQDFGFLLLGVDDIFVLQELISAASSGSENLNKVSSVPRTD